LPYYYSSKYKLRARLGGARLIKRIPGLKQDKAETKLFFFAFNDCGKLEKPDFSQFTEKV
jgi:hypothetical protein